jgi:hypothetical protein
MKKVSTLFKNFNSKTSLVKGLAVVFFFSSIFFVGCYEWRRIIQPDSATINSYFDVFVSAQDDGSPDNDWTNADLVNNGIFGVMIPDGWSVKDSIDYNIVCTEEGYSNSGILVHDAIYSQMLEDSIPSAEGYFWWGAITNTEASMVYFDSLYFSPRIFTGDVAGDYHLRYSIGDMDYWDRNPNQDLSDPLTISIIDNTGIEETLSKANVSLYPNPVSDQLNIQFDNYKSEVIEMDIIDITGKIIQHQQLLEKNNTVRLMNMAEGIYLVKLQNGNISETYKIMVK